MKKERAVQGGDYVFFPHAIRAGVYKVVQGKKHGGSKRFDGLWLSRASTITPLNKDLNVQVIKQDFNQRWMDDWQDIEEVLYRNIETGDVYIEEEVLAEGSMYSGYSNWYACTPSIFPYEELG